MELSDPGALSDLIGRKVVDQDGRRLGRVYEARGHWEPDGTIVLDELVLGRSGMRRRLRGPGGPDREAIPWDSVLDLPGQKVVVHR